MKNGYGSVITPITARHFSKNTEKLYKLLQKTSEMENHLLKGALNALEIIKDKEALKCENANDFCFFLGNILDIEESRSLLIFKYILFRGFIFISNGEVSITDFGKLFLLSDKAAQNLDTIEYFYEKLDWQEIWGKGFSNYLTNDGKRYLASIFSQRESNLKYNSSLGSVLNEKELIWNTNEVILQILNDKSMLYIIEQIIEPLGLIKKIRIENDDWIKIDETSREIFKHYSYGMIDEYNQMLEECWESYDKGNFQEAFDNASGILKVVNNIEAYNVIGCVYIRKKEYEKAKETFNYAIKLLDNYTDNNPGSLMDMDLYTSLYFNLGLSHYYSGDFIPALHIFKDVKKNLPYTLDKVEEIYNAIKCRILLTPMNIS